jgi:hypothetical protein
VTSSDLSSLLDRLRELRAGLHDDAVHLERVPPGTAPGIDLAAFDLHIVRESAYGAFADLEDGFVDRASATLRAVLALQLDAPGRPWDGTFPTTAEQPPPPDEGAIEWLHWDPNWRQFLGSLFALVIERHGSVLAPDLVASLRAAVDRCVAGEPADRIPPWYTNPDLMHAWLLGWVGSSSPSTPAAGEARALAAVERVRRHGDVDEYSSPTYDGVDLMAVGLWVAHPPSPLFAALGAELLTVLGRRIGTLFHPGLGAMCGPYIRTYGLGLDRYVALVGEWLVAAGVPVSSVLPWPLSAETDHVHDLWSTPLVAALAPVVVPFIELRTDLPRRHTQTFGPVTADSLLTASVALGAETGRRPEFAREQHVPVTVHHATGWLGLAAGDGCAGVDARIVDSSSIVATAVPSGPGPVTVRTLWSAAPVDLRVGAIALTSSVAPTSIDIRADHPGHWATLTFDTPPVLTVTVD